VSVNALGTQVSPIPYVCPSVRLSVWLSVCLSVGRSGIVYSGKTADWIRMPFRVMSGVGRGMGVLDGDGDRRRERDSFEGK